jgi:hypothetical protein
MLYTLSTALAAQVRASNEESLVFDLGASYQHDGGGHGVAPFHFEWGDTISAQPAGGFVKRLLLSNNITSACE